MLSNFWTTRILKELVITVGNKPISTNTFFHFGICWKFWCPEGHDFGKSNKHFDQPAQEIGHKTPDSKTYFSNSSKIKKNDEFWKKLIIGNLVCIKTCYSFKPAKPFQWAKQNPKIVILWNHLDWYLGARWTKLPISLKYFWAIILSLDRNDLNNFGPKSQPFQNNPHMRRDASTWKTIYGIHCPE